VQRRSKVVLAWCEGMAAERAERVAADVTRPHAPLAQARPRHSCSHVL